MRQLYRINKQKTNCIIYVTDISQKNHFDMVFKAAKKINIINNNIKIKHITFGFLLKNDGCKIKSRTGNNEKLISLINTAITKAKHLLKNKYPNINKSDLENRSKILGLNAIKYSDLSNNIKQNYKFSYEKILKFNGNTAAFLTYAYVRIMSIIKKEKNMNLIKTNLKNKTKLINTLELDLSIHIIQYEYIINKTSIDLNPNILTTYLYILAEKFHTFFHKHNIIKSKNK